MDIDLLYSYILLKIGPKKHISIKYNRHLYYVKKCGYYNAKYENKHNLWPMQC